jgi:hypothetical protein
MIFRIVLAVFVIALAAVAGLTFYVQAEANYRFESIAAEGSPRALILYHPSRDARFSEDLSAAFAEGLVAQGLAVDRATMTRETPARPEGYALVAVISNTFYLHPDWPTIQYLKRADFGGARVAGLIGGNGTTEKAARILEDKLKTAGGDLIGVRQFWIYRPNTESRVDKPNRDVAIGMAREFGAEGGKAAADSIEIAE